MGKVGDRVDRDNVSFSEYAKSVDETYVSSVKALEDSIKKAKAEFQYAGDAVQDIAERNGRTIPSFTDCWEAVCAEADGKKDIRKAQFKAFATTMATCFNNTMDKFQYLGESAKANVKSTASEFKNTSAADFVKTGVALATVAGVAAFHDHEKDDDSALADTILDSANTFTDTVGELKEKCFDEFDDKQEDVYTSNDDLQDDQNNLQDDYDDSYGNF